VCITSVEEEVDLMRALVLVLVAAATACMAYDRGAQTTVTSASQGATVTGTGATGGSTPETDMQGTGRASGPVVVPQEVARPPAELPTESPPPAPAVDAAAPP
jgi:hypothetical protein